MPEVTLFGCCQQCCLPHFRRTIISNDFFWPHAIGRERVVLWIASEPAIRLGTEEAT